MEDAMRHRLSLCTAYSGRPADGGIPQQALPAQAALIHVEGELHVNDRAAGTMATPLVLPPTVAGRVYAQAYTRFMNDESGEPACQTILRC